MMASLRCLRLVVPLIGFFAFAATAFSQSDRDAIEFYKANLEEFLDEQIAVQVARGERLDIGECEGIAIFLVYTQGSREGGFTIAVIPQTDVKSFSRKFARGDSTRRLTGVLKLVPKDKSKLPLRLSAYTVYISVDGAVLPEETETRTANSD